MDANKSGCELEDDKIEEYEDAELVYRTENPEDAVQCKEEDLESAEVGSEEEEEEDSEEQELPPTRRTLFVPETPTKLVRRKKLHASELFSPTHLKRIKQASAGAKDIEFVRTFITSTLAALRQEQIDRPELESRLWSLESQNRLLLEKLHRAEQKIVTMQLGSDW